MNDNFVKLNYIYTEGYYDGDYWTPDVKPWDEECETVGYFRDLKSAQSHARKMVMSAIEVDGGKDRIKQVFFKENNNRAYYRYRFLRHDGHLGKLGWEFHFTFEHLQFMSE